MSVLEEDTQRAGSREPTENKDPVDGIREKVMCNGGMKITTESSENGSGRGEEDSDPLDRSGTGSERCRHLDTRWTRDEEAVLNPQDISVNGHSSDSTSSGDETEEGDFAANWYVPLPQDPHQDDDDGAEEEEEEGEGWSKGTTGLSPPHREEQKEKEPFGGPDGVVGGASADKIKPLSTMEDSQVEAIKQAMAGFSLPLGSQPQWAQVIPESVWKTELIGGLQQKHRHKSKAKTKQKK